MTPAAWLRACGILVRLIDSRAERGRLAAAAWSGGLLIGLIILITACRSGGGKSGAAVHGGAAAQPSVLLVLVDALRPDHLGCYGYGRPTSPVLDRLASRSVLFENARSVSSWTKPSIPSLFTSLYPSQHGVFEGSVRKKGGAPESDVLPAEATTLAEALKECGYATAAFVHNDQLHRQFGFAQGFDLYEETSEDAPAMIHRMLEWLGEFQRGKEVLSSFTCISWMSTGRTTRPPKQLAPSARRSERRATRGSFATRSIEVS